MCHSETCFRLAWCAVLKNVHFWFFFSNWQGTNFVISKPHVRCLCKETKSTTKLYLFVCLFSCFNCNELKRHCCLPSIWQSLHDANLKHGLEMPFFQNGTQCQSETCFRMAHVSERHATYAFWFFFYKVCWTLSTFEISGNVNCLVRVLLEKYFCADYPCQIWRLDKKKNRIHTCFSFKHLLIQNCIKIGKKKPVEENLKVFQQFKL